MFSKKVAGILASFVLAAASVVSAAKLPRPMADTSIDLPNGKKVRLIDTRGKIRVIVLVSSDCDHCIKVVQSLSKVEREYRAKGVQFYGAAVNTIIPGEVTPFIVRSQASFPIGVMAQYPTTQLADFKENDHPFVPILLFVDKTNHVIFQFFGQDDIFKNQADQEVRTRNVLNTMLSQK